MKCIICSSETEYFFSKVYDTTYSEIMIAIGPVEYRKCSNCGFVLSKTHTELEHQVWSQLNYDFHHYLEDKKNAKTINQPPYAEQALMIAMLSKNGLIDIKSILDFAGGYGTLSVLLEKYFQLHLPVYDPFITPAHSRRHLNPKALSKYNTVLNSAMFEHVLTRKDLDSVNNLVSSQGVLIIHTLVCETVPKDPSWFYLEPPVHTAFHTNKSMSILMQQWGYQSSLYCPQSKCWVLFKNQDMEFIQAKCSEINEELQTMWLYFKQGFMDYWKGF